VVLVIDLGMFERCVCRRMGNVHELCAGVLEFAEQGKRVRFQTRSGEEAKAVVLDGCVFTDGDRRCDGLFLACIGRKKYAVLVELKGVSDLAHAFEQIAFVRYQRAEYREIVENFSQADPRGRVLEKAVIVSNGILQKPDRERLEQEHSVRLLTFFYCEPTSRVPDIREFIGG